MGLFSAQATCGTSGKMTLAWNHNHGGSTREKYRRVCGMPDGGPNPRHRGMKMRNFDCHGETMPSREAQAMQQTTKEQEKKAELRFPFYPKAIPAFERAARS